jgi:exodeoxyribonuclease VII large subunit
MPDGSDPSPLPGLGARDAGPPGTWRVGELTTAIREALDAWFGGELWVEGEIASIRRSAAGHVYFQLVEPGAPGGQPVASVSVALFAAARNHVNRVLRNAGGVRMTDGMRIRIRGRLDLYAPSGTVQLRMSGIDPTYTLGLLASQRDVLVQALEAEGLLRANGSLPLPLVPLHLAVVAAPDSAALADVLHELAASGVGWRVRVLATPVQGVGADRAIAASLARAERLGVDAVLLVRGGGARTDLATFDSEVLARAVCGLSVPVVTGVGHETDTSVADLVAHLACKTPTAAAAAVCDRVRDHLVRVDESAGRLAGAVSRALAAHERRLDESRRSGAGAARHALRRAEHRVDRDGGRVEGAARSHLRAAAADVTHLGAGLSDAGRRALAASARRIDHAEARRALLDPSRTLARGWSITTTADGRVVRSVDDVTDGDEVATRVVDGSITSVVTDRRAPVPPPPA